MINVGLMGTVVLFLISGQGNAVTVSSAGQLVAAIQAANSGGDKSILLSNGTYTLSQFLNISAPDVSVSSLSGQRDMVIIQGDAMSESANVKLIFRVTASGFKLSNVTLQRVGWHLVQVAGEEGGTAPTIRNVVFRDSYQQLFKGTVASDSNGLAVGSSADNGLIEGCLFEYTAGIGPNYYIGGIDVHGGKNWIVRANTFRNIISPSQSIAEFAVHFWNKSANNLVERNVIVNSDRGIGFGLANRGNTAGIIRNNTIYHANNRGSFADTGIYVEDSPNTQIYNNSIYFEHSYPNAIEYRFSLSSGLVVTNNLTNRSITSRDGASGTQANNVVTAQSSWFKDLTSGDLHLAANLSATSVLMKGQAVNGLLDDLDGQPRPFGKIDIGADQVSSVGSTLAAPLRLRIVN